jgi:hypothetical protein
MLHTNGVSRETALWEPRSIQMLMEVFADLRRLNRLAGRGRKHQVCLSPLIASCRPFLQLTNAVLP